jgi:hypothetical protein
MPDAVPIEFDRGAPSAGSNLNEHALDAVPFIGAEAVADHPDLALAVHRDTPTALDEEQGQALGECLKPAMCCRDPAAAQN